MSILLTPVLSNTLNWFDVSTFTLEVLLRVLKTEV